MGRGRNALLATLALLVSLSAADIGETRAPDEIEVKTVTAAPGGLVEVVEGQSFTLAGLTLPSDTSVAHLFIPSIPGEPSIGTLSPFIPASEGRISTKHLRSRGVKTDVTYTLAILARKQNGSSEVVATYRFVMRPVPAVSRVHISALIVRGRPHLVGLELSNIEKDDRVKAWGFGFGAPRGPFEFDLKLTDSTDSTRTYAIPGGLRWAPKSNPKIKLNVSPPPETEQYGVPVLGRLLAGVFRTNRRGNTVFRKTDHWKRCTTSLTNEKFANRPPFPESCVLLGWNRWNVP